MSAGGARDDSDQAEAQRKRADLVVGWIVSVLIVGLGVNLNPLEVWLAASGSTLLALQSILVIVRDWSGKKRKLGAQATEAEARASLAQTEADLMRHLFDQVKEGALQLNPQILLDRISDKELQAMQDLSSNPVALSRLPQTSDTTDLRHAQEQASDQDDSDDSRA